MKLINTIFVPKETVNDQEVKVINIFVKQGELIEKDQLIAEVETSKALLEIFSETKGYVNILTSLGKYINIGEPMFEFYDAKIDKDLLINKVKPKIIEKDLIEEKSNIFSMKAEEFIKKNNLNKHDFLDINFVTTKKCIEFLNTKNQNKLNHLNSTNKKNSIVIIGGGKHSLVCVELLLQMKVFDIAGIIYTKSEPEKNNFGIPILGDLSILDEVFETISENAVVGIGGLGNLCEREDLYKILKQKGFGIPNLIHPKSIIEISVKLGDGNQILAGANIGTNSIVGNNCIINSNTIVSHDCIISDHCHLTPGSILGGSVKVGKNSMIGMGSTILYGTSIGENVIINNNKSIFSNIENNSIIK